jgi:hypothetical protein
MAAAACCLPSGRDELVNVKRALAAPAEELAADGGCEFLFDGLARTRVKTNER